MKSSVIRINRPRLRYIEEMRIMIIDSLIEMVMNLQCFEIHIRMIFYPNYLDSILDA